MKRNLNLIATAASLLLLGMPGESHALQNPQGSLVGSGIISAGSIEEASVPPSVVKSERKLISELKPLTMPKLKQLPTPVRPTSDGAVKLDTSSRRSPVIDKSVARLPGSGMPTESPKSGVPPIIKPSARRLGQAGGARFIPPVVKGNRSREMNQTASELPPIVKTANSSASMSALQFPPVRTASYSAQGSSTRTPLPPVEQSMAPLPAGKTMSAGESSSAPQDMGSVSVVEQPMTSDVSGDYFSARPMVGEVIMGEQFVGGDAGCATCAPVVGAEGACATCGTGMTDGVCSTCGPGAGYSNGPAIQDFGTFGSVSASRRYFHAESLIMTRADGDLFGTNIAPLTDFDYAPGMRLTFGKKSDSIFGRELGIMALADVSEDVTTRNNQFLSVDFQSQNKESDIYSIEYNRVNWGWDLVKTFVGFKFLRFDDSYRIATASGARGPQPEQRDVFDNVIVPAQAGRSADSGFFSMDASNSLFGVQVGGELFYDIGYRWSTSVGGKWGAFLNLNDFDTVTIGNSGTPFETENDGSTISTAAELNILAHYQIRTNLRFKGGYNLLYVGNVATVSDNFAQRVPTINGINTGDSDDVFFHGFSLGLEFYR